MIILNLLLLPVKLSVKLLLYTIGGIILAVIFMLTAINGVLSGLVKFVGVIIILAAAFAVSSMFFTIGFSMVTFVTILISCGFMALMMCAPDIIQAILNQISKLSYLLFDIASFKLLGK